MFCAHENVIKLLNETKNVNEINARARETKEDITEDGIETAFDVSE